MKNFARSVLMMTIVVITIGNLSPKQSEAAFIVGNGTGSGVSSVDRMATFDNLITGTNLLNYTEGGLRIAVPGQAFEEFDPTQGNGGFSGGFFYSGGGSNAFTSIKTTDGSSFVGLEFNVADGFFGSNPSFVHYVALDGTTVIASGTIDVTRGSVLGFRSTSSFTELQFGAYQTEALAQSATSTSFQAGALDNLKVQLSATGGVPEPSSIILCGIAGLIGFGGYRVGRRRLAS